MLIVIIFIIFIFIFIVNVYFIYTILTFLNVTFVIVVNQLILIFGADQILNFHKSFRRIII